MFYGFTTSKEKELLRYGIYGYGKIIFQCYIIIIDYSHFYRKMIKELHFLAMVNGLECYTLKNN